jgi:ABC-2 type transport system permease protein
MMIIDIAKFELSRHLKRPSTYVYFVGYAALICFWTLLSGGAIEGVSLSIDSSKILTNGSYSVTSALAFIGVLGLISVAAFMGQAVYQDFHYQMHSLVFVKPITKFQFLAGRFLGTFAILALIFLSLPFGAYLATVIGMIPAESLGPNSFSLYMTPYISFVLVNILWAGSIFFALAALLRKMMPVYISSMLMLIGWIASAVAVNASGTGSDNLATLLDPFGMEAIEQMAKYWSIHEKNTLLMAFEGSVLLNRLMWLVVGSAILFLCYYRFDFVEALPGKKLKKEAVVESRVTVQAVAKASYGQQLFDAFSLRQAFFSMVKLELLQTLKNRYFVVLMLGGFGFCCFCCQ